MVAVCADSPAAIRRGRGRHGAGFPILSDQDLEVTDRYNLRHEKALTPKRGIIRPLPIPTTILVDAGGIVRWIDQAENYQVRSHPDRVMAAIHTALGSRTVPEAGSTT